MTYHVTSSVYAKKNPDQPSLVIGWPFYNKKLNIFVIVYLYDISIYIERGLEPAVCQYCLMSFCKI